MVLKNERRAEKKVARREPGWESGGSWKGTHAAVLAGLLVCFETEVLVALRSTGGPLPP